ncbi:universal stress protein [Litorilinea aerophila]|uniref:Universal stress protein n=1 Tax=Litorilinea aerophila TaxID=1204385 RepID=A0A540VM61_9CHLR|nr:universal stress protein [Litorilinea aerophila]MCC9075316.1 universal stress protein [Litorilinea aerophila]GIV79303.1 MAG: universal stress protein UspA [Litorilinea sp.]
MFTHLLVPLDGSALAECVLPHVVAFARSFQARVTLLHVLDDEGFAEQDRPVDPLEWHLRKSEFQAYLDEVGKRLAAVGVETEKVILEGEPAQTIIDFARSQAVDLIVLSSHGKSGLNPWNVSNLVHKVVQRAITSLLIVRAYRTELCELGEFRYRRILLPLDGSVRAENVLAAATALAEASDATLVVAHVLPQLELVAREPLSAQDRQLVEQVRERNRREAEAYLEQLAARLPSNTSRHLLVSDDVEAALHDLVMEESIDLVILSAHGYSGQPRWPVGSVTANFIMYGTTPLLIVQDLGPDQQALLFAEHIAHQQGGVRIHVSRTSAHPTE